MIHAIFIHIDHDAHEMNPLGNYNAGTVRSYIRSGDKKISASRHTIKDSGMGGNIDLGQDILNEAPQQEPEESEEQCIACDVDCVIT